MDRQFLTLRHLPEISQIGRNDGDSIRTRQMRNPAASGRRRIRHYGHTGTLEQIGQCIFRNVSAEFDARIAGTPLFHRVDITARLRMISACDDQLHIGQLLGDQVESLDHQFESFVGAPFSKSENAMDRISAPCEIGEFRPARQNAMRAQMNVVPSVFVIQDFAITGHQNRDGIGEQKHSRGNRAREPVQPFIANADVFQFHRVHQVMQGHVGIASTQARQQRRHQSAESHQRIATKCAEQQVEPNHVWLHALHGPHQAHDASYVIEGPATYNRKSLRLDVPLWEFVGEHGETEKRITL